MTAREERKKCEPPRVDMKRKKVVVTCTKNTSETKIFGVNLEAKKDKICTLSENKALTNFKRYAL